MSEGTGAVAVTRTASSVSANPLACLAASSTWGAIRRRRVAALAEWARTTRRSFLMLATVHSAASARGSVVVMAEVIASNSRARSRSAARRGASAAAGVENTGSGRRVEGGRDKDETIRTRNA